MSTHHEPPGQPRGALCRPGFEGGRALTADDLAAEQRFRRHRMRRHRRHLHDWGIHCGLWVVADASSAYPWRVRVCPGYGIDPRYREVLLVAAEQIDLAEHAWSAPPGVTSGDVYLGVAAVDRTSRPLPEPRSGCDCPEREFVDSRVEDALRFRVLWDLPAEQPTGSDICEPGTLPCVPCPELPLLPLAMISLPATPAEPIGQAHINNDVAARL